MTDDKAARLAVVRATNAATSAPAEPAETSLPAPIVPADPSAVALAVRVAPPRPGAAAGDLLDLDHLPPAMPLATLALLLVGASVGAFAAVVALPAWLPGLSDSLFGAEPKAYWYLSRSSAMVAYILTWLAMLLGLLITSRAARLWPGGPVAFDLHQHASLLSLAFGLFHALILLGDQYIKASLAQILVPFAYGGYEPLWVGLGQLTLYMLAIVGLSFYVKPLLGRRAWRLIHFLSFALFALALAHGIVSGSDTGAGWAQALYWATGGSVLFLSLYRMLMAFVPASGKRRTAA
ncbi:MAG: hypothetical protein HGA45_42205 [Chloroflexales bacterium]|nr:hypothetical protein [Chloroflexales bacterium]